MSHKRRMLVHFRFNDWIYLAVFNMRIPLDKKFVDAAYSSLLFSGSRQQNMGHWCRRNEFLWKENWNIKIERNLDPLIRNADGQRNFSFLVSNNVEKNFKSFLLSYEKSSRRKNGNNNFLLGDNSKRLNCKNLNSQRN